MLGLSFRRTPTPITDLRIAGPIHLLCDLLLSGSWSPRLETPLNLTYYNALKQGAYILLWLSFDARDFLYVLVHPLDLG